MLATDYAKYYNIDAQKDGESDSLFMSRVSGVLRGAGHIIEAHEVAQNKRYDADDGDNVMAGIAGAMAMALRGKDYGRKGYALIGDEIAAGTIALSPKKDTDPMMLLLAAMLSDR